MRIYYPDKWILVEMEHGGETFRKVLGGWSGGYLDSDSWRLSSPVEKIIDCGDYYEFRNYSGSVYECGKNSEGVTGITGAILEKMINSAKEQNTVFRVVEDVELLVDRGVH